jgi:hypothetical protein
MAWVRQAAKHDADHRRADEGGSGSAIAFEIAGHAAKPADPGECSLHDRLYNVAKLGFEWSSVIERRGRRRRPLLVAVGPKQDTSQFVTGDSESTQDLMRHRRPAAGPMADGGPAHGSPSTASARVIRGDKVRLPAPDRGLRSPRTDGATDEPAAQAQQCSAVEDEGGDSDSARR